MIQFVALQIHPQRPTYGAVWAQFTFVITRMDNGKFHASAKRVGAKALDGTRIELGNWNRFVDAAQACERFARKPLQ